MYIIKNRVNGEYDTKGIYGGFHKVKRNAWDKLAHARNHVLYKLNISYGKVDPETFNWYMNADFIEIGEDGAGVVIPVSDYLREYYKDSYKIVQLTEEQKNRLGLGDY